jgi:FkbH-like protein
VSHEDDLFAEVKAILGRGTHAPAFERLKAMADPVRDFLFQSRCATLCRRLDVSALDLRPLRVALVGSSTLEHFSEVLRFWLACEGFRAEILVPPFDTYRQLALEPRSELYEFAPDFVWLFTHYRDVRLTGGPDDTVDALHAVRQGSVDELRQIWRAIQSRGPVHIIQNNADVPAERVFGNFECQPPWTPVNMLRQFNVELGQAAPPGVTVFDIEHLSSLFGKSRWHDSRYWHHSKHAFSLDASGLVAFHGARVMGAVRGKAKKCLVLDLDNTLWGGVVGDLGLGGIELGAGAAGEAFVAFQEYLKRLSARGILLAVCSKSEDTVAREPFLRHPAMRLKLEDVAVFSANWDNKADNIREIARRLNLGLDSLVFIDDNPAERGLVRCLLPEVTVPEMPDDPADFVAAVDGQRLFETIAVSPEDRKRGQMYRANAARESKREASTDLADFLKSLRMKASVGHLDDFHLGRIAQLVNKSNQFHLTGKRYSEAELSRLAATPSKDVMYFTLADVYGDNGLISVVVLEQEDDTLVIDTWVMSCRVLSRGMEEFIANELVAVARARGCRRLIGRYVPTKKNQLVADLYRRLRFEPITHAPDGSVESERRVGDADVPYVTFIERTTTPDLEKTAHE